VLLFGGDFWDGLHLQLDRMERQGAIASEDRARMRRVSTPEEAAGILRSCHAGLCASLHKPPLRKPRSAS
jgi:hypothetical protein